MIIRAFEGVEKLLKAFKRLLIFRFEILLRFQLMTTGLYVALKIGVWKSCCGHASTATAAVQS